MRLHGVSRFEGLEATLAKSLPDPTAGGLVFAAGSGRESGWEGVEAEMLSAFELTQQTFAAGEPIVYLVRQQDLLGQDGPAGAMLASALLSAARALAMEDRRETTVVNVLAVDETSDVEVVASWIALLLGRRGVSGEVIRLGRSHLGKLVP